MGETSQQKHRKTIQHPLFGISTRKWIRLITENKGIDTPYLNRAAFITILSLCTVPARLLFHIIYDKKINETKLQQSPVFIIGHWRSGTSYLHELMSQDPQFCYISLWNTLLPDSFLIMEPFKQFLSQFLPTERPMDAIKVDIDGPYEEEAGLAVISPYSFFHCLHFPRNAEEQYLKSIHFHEQTKKEKDQWKKMYLTYIKTITYTNHGKRLLSKNPPNTARIPTLLDIFPDAKFIHIYRNPYKVYLSTKKMRKNVLTKLALQKESDKELEDQIINNYKRLMTSFFTQEKQIPAGNYVEIKYEDLVQNPLKQITKIYTTLQLPGLEQAIPHMKAYLQQQSGYKTNVYTIDKQIIEHVNTHWQFTLDRWNYLQKNGDKNEKKQN